MARRSTIGNKTRDVIAEMRFATIPVARRNEIIDEVQQKYLARLNEVKSHVNNLPPAQREEFHQTLATMLTQVTFKRSET
ncbi:hypothetical protein M8320_00445 [Leclercia sp. H6W5]|uniref:Uncharacterized protein n=2 Tax=Leclercia TaxID=83654 RepID=A0ABS7RZN9_9ENTR|nr:MULTISPECIES: hypothetical protein [Leclercia]MBZ0059770.1 hypothetical protein [Leclercia sp. EMC7]MCU6680496.1 hypothetical protein [Leclercia tamurae]